MVFQQFNLFPHLTVLDNVIEAPVHVLKLPRDEAITRAKTLLDRVGLAEKIDVRPDKLSGGQQQRVAIARALAMQPKAMLFDEPTSALDPRMTAEVLDVMADLAASGQTMIVVTHAMNFARRAAKTVHVFHEGTRGRKRAAAQIFDAPQKRSDDALLARMRCVTLSGYRHVTSSGSDSSPRRISPRFQRSFSRGMASRISDVAPTALQTQFALPTAPAAHPSNNAAPGRTPDACSARGRDRVHPDWRSARSSRLADAIAANTNDSRAEWSRRRS